MTGYRTRLNNALEQGLLPQETVETLIAFCESYHAALGGETVHESPLLSFIDRALEMHRQPYEFPPYHKAERAPFDFYQLGLDIFRPLVLRDQCKIYGENILDEITRGLSLGENVIFLANHQAEADPQALSILLEEKYPHLAVNMAFVAGHRVTTDPLAIPLSRGRNLICIYSKRHMERPPEQREHKQRHNYEAMLVLRRLLDAGGVCLYVAPSGGRDRPGENGLPEVTPFDPDSVDLFRLLAKKAKCPTRCYPMSLSTYQLLPPPKAISSKLGEERHTSRTPVHLWVGEEIHWDELTDPTIIDKNQQRDQRAHQIHARVVAGYKILTEVPCE